MTNEQVSQSLESGVKSQVSKSLDGICGMEKGKWIALLMNQ